ncbi:hypothetical protein HU200_028557 [Digitaria exilis]|uniref:DUF4220 domain-containing protein n=1 Tax=Digitaria exilis TaxID=1010633 RepID=A0A835BS33_9POAL|nr:hypothetical protein HU200_028557 [Digitaria exilis]
MGGGQVLAHAWSEWGLQALVLLSFTLQVVLLVLGELRRRIDSGLLRLDGVHDGGRDGHIRPGPPVRDGEQVAGAPSDGHHSCCCTAYAIDDNRLWLRHLQTLAVQTAAAGQVVYLAGDSSRRHSLLWWATVLIFAVGVAKYGERVWALRRAAEAYLLMSHRMLEVPKELFKGPKASGRRSGYSFESEVYGKDLYKVVEMQLSLMHDVRPAVATAAAFLLFNLQLGADHRGNKGSYNNRVDVAVTYVVSAGAVVLETASLVRSMFSSWTCPLLLQWSLERWHGSGDQREFRNYVLARKKSVGQWPWPYAHECPAARPRSRLEEEALLGGLHWATQLASAVRT